MPDYDGSGELQRLRERISELEEENTNLKGLEEVIHRNSAAFEALLANSREGIALTTPDRRIIRIVRSLGNYGPTDMAGASVEELIHPDDRALIHNCYNRLLEGHEHRVAFEVRLICADGSLRWVEGTFTDLLDHPAVQAIVCNHADISERKKYELMAEERSR